MTDKLKEQAVLKIAQSQYTRFTGRNWDKTSEEEKSLWFKSASSDVDAFFREKLTVMPVVLTVKPEFRSDLQIACMSAMKKAFLASLAENSGIEHALSNAYSAVRDTCREGGEL